MGKILITGGTGFIGSCLTRRLAASGQSVRVLMRKGSPNAKKLSGLPVEIAIGDVCQPETLPEAMAGVTKVFHCAAIAADWAPLKEFYEVNVNGARNVLSACVKAGVEKFIGISTNDVFGIVEGRTIDETMPFQKWNEPYPDTKILAEELVWQYHREQRLPVATVYPCWVYGVGDTTFLPHIVESLAKKEMVFWRKNSLMWPVYIENLLDLLILVSEDDRATGHGYLIHDGKCLTFREFCALVADSLELPRPSLRLPYWPVYGAALAMQSLWRLAGVRTRPLLTTYVVKNLGSRMQFSIKKAEEHLGWKPKTSFEEGFATTMGWARTAFARLLDKGTPP